MRRWLLWVLAGTLLVLVGVAVLLREVDHDPFPDLPAWATWVLWAVLGLYYAYRWRSGRRRSDDADRGVDR